MAGDPDRTHRDDDPDATRPVDDPEATQSWHELPPDPDDATDLASTEEGAPSRGGHDAPLAYPSIAGYRITGRLGEGGMGTVWRAIQLSTRREVALKLMGESRIGSGKARRRFEREVELAASLEHPNIAQVYEAGQHQGVYYYAMQLIEGLPLDQFVAAENLEQRQVLELMSKVCRAMEAAHRRGVIHRDLKPSNILVTPHDGQPHVLDFGLAKTLLEECGQVTLTQEGEVAGTPAYMAPEQARGDVQQVDLRADVYALGVILYRLLTGEHPHDLSGPRFAVMKRIIEDEPRRPRDASGRCDNEVEAILLMALAKQPDQRYGSAGALAQDIESYLRGDPISARPATLTYFLKKRLRKHRLPIAVAALILVTLASLVTYGYFSERSLRHRAEEAEGLATKEARRANTEADRAGKLAKDLQIELYASRVREANLEVRNDNLDAALKLLNECPAALRGWEWNYMYRLCHGELATLGGGEGKCNQLATSPDGKLVAIALQSNKARFWDIPSRTSAFTLEHDASVYSVAFSPDGRMIATGSIDEELRVWDAKTRRMLWSVTGRNFTAAIAFSPDSKLVAAGKRDRRMVTLTDAATGELVKELDSHSSAISRVVFSPDGSKLASSSWDGTVVVWDLQKWSRLHTFRHPDKGYGLAFSPDGANVAVVSYDGMARVWDADTGKLLHKLRHGSLPTGLKFAPDGKHLLTASGSIALLWDLEREEVVRRYRHTDRAIYDVDITADGSTVVTGDDSGRVVLWAADTDDGMVELAGVNGPVTNLALSRDERTLIAAISEGFGSDGSYRGGGKVAMVWRDHGRWELAHTLTGHRRGVRAVSLSPNGRTAATGSIDRTIKLWDVASGQALKTLEAHEDEVRGVAYGPDGKRLYSAGFDGSLRVWDVEQGTNTHTSYVYDAEVWGVAVTSDGRRLVSAARDGTLTSGLSGVLSYDLADGDAVVKFKTPRDRHMFRWVRCPVVSPDGKWVVGAFNTRNVGRVARWEAATGKVLNEWTEHRGEVLCAAVSPDGRWIASGGVDASVQLRNAESGEVRHVLRGNDAMVNQLAFDRGSKRLCSASADGELRIWRLSDGKLLHRLQGHASAVLGVVFAPEGKRLYSAGRDMTLRVWDAEWGKLASTHNLEAGAATCLAMNPSGALLAVGIYEDHSLRLWSTDPMREEKVLKGHANWTSGCCFTPDGRQVVSSSLDGSVRVWDADSGKPIHMHRPHATRFTDLAMSHDGKHLATAGIHGSVILWNEGGQRVGRFVHGKSVVNALAFDANGERLVTGGIDGKIHVWSVPGGEKLLSLVSQDGSVQAVAFSPSGNRLLSTGEKNIAFWDLSSGKQVFLLRVGLRPWALAFSRDGRKLFVGGPSYEHDRNIVILNAGDSATGRN